MSPIAFEVFDGHYKGVLGLTLDAAPAFRFNASLSGIDVAKALAFLGRADSLSGRLSGTIDVSGRGLTAESILKTARGRSQLSIADGVIKRLGLVRQVVLLGSMRSSSQQAATASPVSSDEPFSLLRATFDIGDGQARTRDLSLDATNLQVTATGAVALDGHMMAFDGRMQLSETLSKQAGQDLLRYTREDGRVTLPIDVSGSISDPVVAIDLASSTRRALINRANEEVGRKVQDLLERVQGR
jgi:AsmA protein